MKFRPNFWNFIVGPYCAEKNSHKYFRMLFAPRQGGTSINESQKEDTTFFFFEKPVLFTLGLGLSTPYFLGILVWKFYETFVTVSIKFWLRFEPRIRPTRLAVDFLFVTFKAERKVRLCVKQFDFFRGWILIRLSWNLSRFVPNSVEILGWNFRKQLFRENFSEILCKPTLSSTETCEIPS